MFLFLLGYIVNRNRLCFFSATIKGVKSYYAVIKSIYSAVDVHLAIDSAPFVKARTKTSSIP